MKRIILAAVLGGLVAVAPAVTYAEPGEKAVPVATAMKAIRVAPPVAVITEIPDALVPVPVPGRCVQWEFLLRIYSPGWDVVRMSKIMYRESRCDMTVRSRTSDSCGLQINDINLKYLRKALGEWVDKWTLMSSPDQCVRAAAELYKYWYRASKPNSGYRPWAMSS